MSAYYNNLTLTEDKKFKNNNYTLCFGLDEVELIYEHLDSPVSELKKLTNLSEATVRRIIQTINANGFDDFIIPNPIDGEIHETSNGTVNIHDIHINIYNQAANTSIEEQRKNNSTRLKEWGRKIRERGHHICAKCGKIDKIHNQAHHIFPKSRYPSLACDEGNGIILCQKCHAEYHKSYLGKESVYNFIGWLNE